MRDLGYEPVIFRTVEPYNSRADIAELRYITFIDTDLLWDVVFRLERETEYSPTDNSRPITDLCYSHEKLAQLYKLDYEVINNVNALDFVKRIHGDKKIIGAYSIRNYQIFDNSIINAFKQKDGGFVWNMHTGLLPKYKGVYIPYHAIENAEKIYGWTLHDVERDIDAGNLLAIDWLTLDSKISVLSTYLNMIPKGTDMLKTVLWQYKKGKSLQEKQQPRSMSASYFTYPTSIQMQKHNRAGVIFAANDEIVDIYMRHYTLPETAHSKELEKRLKNAIRTKMGSLKQKNTA